MKSNVEEPLNRPILYTLVFGLTVRSNSVSKKPSKPRYSVFLSGANTSFELPPQLQMGGGGDPKKWNIAGI